ncbi:uracil-DNA glycosylase [Duganella sp. BuS-21]|uniref:uracil-DNA glycosylase n=1 Tax=Duganella sp. BuS-21 TaxID=2943848 RepID=UPI0035A57CD4
MNRSTVFLQEMGIGVQWKLRNGVADVAGEEGATADAEAPDTFVSAVQALADGWPVAEALPAAPSAPVAPAAARPDAPPAAPAAAPRTPAPTAAPAAAAAGDDAMAWFDNAPTPPPSAAPARPASRPSASAAAPRAPAAEEAVAEGESTSWFDDAPAPARAAPVSDAAIAVMDWPTLKAAVSTCTRCDLCATRRNAVNGRGPEQARWIAFSGAPSRLDDRDAQAVAGEAGQLLHNMLKAIDLQPDTDVYITNVVKCRPATPDGADRAPTAEEVVACRPYLERELVLTGATMAMTFGQMAAKGLMMGPAARGKVMHYGAAQLPVVASYHPEDLLRKPEDKAKAWADLCLAKASHA